MKTIFLFALIAVTFASTIAAPRDCSADNRGIPDCTADAAAGVNYRDNWDPVHYWVCDGATPVQKSCTLGYLYDPVTEGCISEDQWEWTPVCPQE